MPVTANISTATRKAVVSGVVGQNSGVIAVHIAKKLMFWTDFTERNIKRASFDGSEVQTIVTDIGVFSSALAVDWVGDVLYWIQRSPGYKMEVSNLDGSNRTKVRSMHQTASTLALDAEAG